MLEMVLQFLTMLKSVAIPNDCNKGNGDVVAEDMFAGDVVAGNMLGNGKSTTEDARPGAAQIGEVSNGGFAFTKNDYVCLSNWVGNSVGAITNCDGQRLELNIIVFDNNNSALVDDLILNCRLNVLVIYLLQHLFCFFVIKDEVIYSFPTRIIFMINFNMFAVIVSNNLSHRTNE